MELSKNFTIKISEIFKNKVIVDMPVEFMMNAIKIKSMESLSVSIDLYKIHIEGLVPNKVYENLELIILDINGKINEFNIESFKTLSGDRIESFISEFYTSFTGEHIDEVVFNKWMYDFNNNIRTFTYFVYDFFNKYDFFENKINDFEFLYKTCEILIKDLSSDTVYFWSFYMESKLKGLDIKNRRRSILCKIIKEFEKRNKECN